VHCLEVPDSYLVRYFCLFFHRRYFFHLLVSVVVVLVTFIDGDVENLHFQCHGPGAIRHDLCHSIAVADVAGVLAIDCDLEEH